MKISELIAALVRIAAERGDLPVFPGSGDGKVYPRDVEMRIDTARVGLMLVLE